MRNCIVGLATLAYSLIIVAVASPTYAELLPHGVLNDEQTSIVYYPETGGLGIDAPNSTELTSFNVDSRKNIFTGVPRECDARWPYQCHYSCPRPTTGCSDENLFFALFGGSVGSIDFGDIALPRLSHDIVLNDLTVVGSLAGGPDLGPVDLVYMHELLPGDANRDFAFDQLDFVQVQQAGKYLSGQPATWGEGDWDGAPGGSPGNPPPGDGVFDQKDIVAALAAGNYLQGPYAGNVGIAAIPEPPALVLLGVGAFAVSFGRWRRRGNAA